MSSRQRSITSTISAISVLLLCIAFVFAFALPESDQLISEGSNENGNVTELSSGPRSRVKEESFADIIDRTLEKEFTENDQNEVNESGGFSNSVAEQQDDGILVIPTVAEPPPKIGAKEIQSEDYQIRSCSFSSIASMSGGCQVCVPMGFHDKCPISVSFVARQGNDRFLLDTIQTMYASLQEQAATKSSASGNTMSKEASADMAKEKGNQAYKEKQWQKAIGLYSEAIKLNGNSATYFSNWAAAYLELGNLHQADCSKAIDLDKKNVKAYLRRGTAREMLGYYKGAIEDFRYALVLEPPNKRAAQSADRPNKLFP